MKPMCLASRLRVLQRARIMAVAALLAALCHQPGPTHAGRFANGFGLTNLNVVAVTYTFSFTGHFPGQEDI